MITFQHKALPETNNLKFHEANSEPWTITLVDTGSESMTGGRIRRIRPYLDPEEPFCLTYGDGVGDVDIQGSIAFHKSQKRLATMTVVSPPGRFGSAVLNGNKVVSFQEKTDGSGGQINAGFFICETGAIDYIAGDETTWEQDPLHQMSKDDQLSAWVHEGFWQPMDTLRERRLLDQLLETNQAPWVTWE